MGQNATQPAILSCPFHFLPSEDSIQNLLPPKATLPLQTSSLQSALLIVRCGQYMMHGMRIG